MKTYSRELSTIAAVLMNLHNQRLVVDTPEEQLVVEALRRSSGALHDASLAELGTYVRGLGDQQLRGLANNIKGIYHELLFVHEYNATNGDAQAYLHPSTNHPGSDVIVRDVTTAEIVREIQLKATDNLYYATPRPGCDPNVERLGTDEVAARSEHIGSSGFADVQLEADVGQQFDQLPDVSTMGQLEVGAESGTLVAGGLRALQYLKGDVSPGEAIRKTAADAAIATGTTAFVTFLFS
jgi:hypothetical protein